MVPTIQYLRGHKFALTFILVILYQFLCALQGFDLSDEGWGMYFYQQIFKNPECVIAQMPYWLTGIIGGAWNYLLPQGGYLGTRVLGILLVTGTFCLSYTFLKKSIRSGWLLVGLVIQIIIVAGDPKPYGYNSLTVFFVLLALLAFLRGLESNKLHWLFGGGLLLGINVFVRLPNIAILPVMLLIPLYLYEKDSQWHFFDRRLWMGILGGVLGIVVMLATIYIGGYWPLFQEAILGVSDSASDVNNSHELSRMIVQYASNYKNTIGVGAVVTASGILYAWIKNKDCSRAFRTVVDILFIILLAVFFLCTNSSLRNIDHYFIHFISYVGLALILFRTPKTKLRLRYLAWAALLMIILIPLGSDRGIVTIWVSTWLALPLAVFSLFHYLDGRGWQGWMSRLPIDRNLVKRYGYMLFAVFIGVGIYQDDNCAYYDPGSRLQKTHAINNEYCRFIYTVPYRAELMNNLLPVLKRYVKPNDYLMVYNFMPGINYLTDTRSYISNCWLWCLSGSEMEEEFKAAKIAGRPLPIVLRHHFRATSQWQPYDPSFIDSNRTRDDYFSRYDQVKAINDFLQTNKYKRAWTNGYFDILLPPTLPTQGSGALKL
ncbi:MAG: hypothetical protein LBN24_04450 [Mediterranea sp.]|jgi:hypothetical protein|nr:hypothetical protein [Mediterranea sp.]